jgi:hypothetical protein
MESFSDHQLIFLVSQPRAGSTLLQHILAGHEAVQATAEPWLMLHPVYALRENGHTAEYDERLAHGALHDFLQSLPLGKDDYRAALRVMALYLYGQACLSAGKLFFLDKTPRYYYILPELAQIFPAARFVILLRNPLAVLSSILDSWVQGRWVHLPTFRDDLLRAPSLLAEGAALLDARARIIRYEELVETPEKSVMGLCDWLGLAYNADMLEYGLRKRLPGRYGDSTGLDEHERPSVDSRDKWLNLGRSAQTRHLAESYLQALGPELLEWMGYDAAELRSQLSAVPSEKGRVFARWQQLFPVAENRLNRLALVWAGFRQTGKAGNATRQAWRIISGGSLPGSQKDDGRAF